jgi:hypothetical protein
MDERLMDAELGTEFGNGLFPGNSGHFSLELPREADILPRMGKGKKRPACRPATGTLFHMQFQALRRTRRIRPPARKLP